MENIDKLPEQKYLQEAFTYNEITGSLTWKERPLHHFKNDVRVMKSWNTRMANKKADCIKAGVSIVIRLDNKDYMAYRIIWKMIHNEEAIKFIHINGDLLDNSLLNLKPDNTIKEKVETKEFKISTLPDLEYLNERFLYDENTGILTWKERHLEHFTNQHQTNAWNARYANKPAGSINDVDYIVINIEGYPRLAHRIIWKMYYGVDPENLIDHINGNRRDNRIINLREAKHLNNNVNLKKPKSTNTSGAIGVNYIKTSGKWRARLTYDGKKIHIGMFDTLEEASAAREAKAKELHGEFYSEIEIPEAENTSS